MARAMRHLFLFAFIFFLSALLQIHLNDLKAFSHQLQKTCAEKLDANSPVARDLNRALACGIDLPSRSAWKQLLTRTGLYHLVVVSGSHLVLLEVALRGLPGALFGSMSVLLLLMTGLQAPLARGLCARYAPISARGPFRVALVHFLTLGAFPDWSGSLSLALSTAASFGLAVRTPPGKWRYLAQLILPWLFTFPLVAGFSPPHPTQLWCNILGAGFITFALTPLAYLQLLWPALNLDGLYLGFQKVLFPLASLNPATLPEGPRLGQAEVSFYLLSLFLLTHVWNIRFLRQS